MQRTPTQSLASFMEENGPVTSLTDLLDDMNANQQKHKQWQQFSGLGKAEVKVMEYQSC